MKYIIYCRKSTDTEDKQVLSLESQQSELFAIAKKEQLNVVKVFTESMSAKEPGRPQFNEAIKLISKGKADAILCWKIDRLTRNPIDGGQIQWMLQTEKIKCIKTFEKSYFPNDNVLLMNIEQAMATQYIRELSLNVKRGNRAKLERGEWPNHAPLGYLNDKATKTIVVDKTKAHYLKKVFELYATGGTTLQQISVILYKEGFRTNTGRRIGKSQLHRVLNNRFYYGIMEREGRYFKGNHAPIITIDLFNKAQDILMGRLHPKPKKHFYAARGFAVCADCGCAITADTKKGHKYYYCTNGKGSCQQHKQYIRSEYLDNLIAGLFEKLILPEKMLSMSCEAYTQLLEQNNANIAVIDTLKHEAHLLSKKELMLVEGYSSQIIKEDIYKLKIAEIESKRIDIELQISQMESKSIKREPTFEQIKSVMEYGHFASKVYLTASEQSKKEHLEMILSNIHVKDKNIHSYQFKSPYHILEKVSKNATFEEMLAAWDDIRKSLITNNIADTSVKKKYGLRESG